jgi:hypothetical protein
MPFPGGVSPWKNGWRLTPTHLLHLPSIPHLCEIATVNAEAQRPRQSPTYVQWGMSLEEPCEISGDPSAERRRSGIPAAIPSRRSREFPLSEARRSSTLSSDRRGAEFREFQRSARPRTGRRFHTASERDIPQYKDQCLIRHFDVPPAEAQSSARRAWHVPFRAPGEGNRLYG